MKLVVGLGNPGSKYEGTRHNVGFEVLDGVAGKHGVQWSRKPDAEIGRCDPDVVLVKPLTFMNLSGSAVQRWAAFYKVPFDDLLIVVDDVNLDAGRLRIRRSGSAGGHNGLKSIIASLGTDQFARLRIGVGGGSQRNLSSHVLGKFGPEEEAVIEAATEKAVAAVEMFIAEGVVAAMNTFNRKDDNKAEDN